MNVQEVVSDVVETGKKVAKRETQRFSEAATVGDVARQGDVYFMAIDKLPTGAARIKDAMPQLAPGTTQGSRHILDSMDGVAMYSFPMATAFDGPILHLTAEREVAHPDHGHIILPPGKYAVTYQRTQENDFRVSRVLD